MTALGGLAQVVGIVAAVAFLVPLLLIGVFVIVVVANRADPDPSGRRPLAVYLFAASFVTLFTTMFASYGVIGRLASLIGTAGSGSDSFSSDSSDSSDLGLSSGSSSFSDSSSSGSGVIKHPVGDAVTREAILFLLVGLVAGAVLYLHLRAAGRITGDDVARGGPVGRVRSSYVAAVSFLSLAIAVVFSIVTLYTVFQLISPTIFSPGGDGKRVEVLRTLLPALYFVLLSVTVLVLHLRSTPPDQRPSFRRPRPVAPPFAGPYDVSTPQPGYGAPIGSSYAPPGQQPDLPDLPARPAGPPTGGDVLGRPARPRPTPGRDQ